MLITITPATGVIRRYEGKQRTHTAELQVPLSSDVIPDLMRFRCSPTAVEFTEDFDPPQAA